jgi:antitoxin (DNA-binding transcriptional repressor) of toxin-antitoxin stability system
MKTLTVADLKSGFSGVINDIRNGEDILIEYGKKHEKIGVIIPYSKYLIQKRKTGILKGKCSYKIEPDFKISDEELLSL